MICKMFLPGNFQSCVAKRLLAPCPTIRRFYSANEMRSRVYPHLFPFAMLNIMNHGKRFLKVEETEDLFVHNCVRIESNGLIDPYVTNPEEGS